MTKVSALLSRLENGWAAMPDLQREFGWKPHTIRAAMSVEAKRRGMRLERTRESGITSYRVDSTKKSADK